MEPASGPSGTWLIIGVSALALMVLVLSGSPAMSSPGGSNNSHLAVTSQRNNTTHSFSRLWAGYYVATGAGKVSEVQGSWIEPRIQGVCTSNNSYANFAVGIGGVTSSAIVAIGTSAGCVGGHAQYWSWFELSPGFGGGTGLSIAPGDGISARVHFIGQNNYTLSLNDSTSGKSFTVTHAFTPVTRTSAEWIVLATTITPGGITALADFGTVAFHNCTATISGIHQTIGGFASTQVQMVKTHGAAQLKARASTLAPGGAGFSVKWISAGP